MFKRSKVCTAALVALGGTLAAGSAPVFGQQTLDRVEITGSSVRRIDAESSVPVIVLKKEDIAKTGATSTVDLLQRLSTVQGSTTESGSVGGSTFGFSGVSLHSVGETRTLVLLNGHRLSLFGGQTLTGFAAGMDLNAIPVSAIERIEVLTDGASALYGADAIAGVVNFITRRDTSEGDVTVGISNPKGGAREKRITASKGFGSLAQDGFNVFIAAGHDERTKLDSTARDFAKTGKVFFNLGNSRYRFQQFSASPIPANATDDLGQLISPYLKANGTCPANTFRVTENYTDAGQPRTDDYCGFDFVSTLEIYPVRERDSLFATLNKQIGDHTLFADFLYSKTKQTSRIAPVPGGISIPAGSALHNQYLLPLGITGDSTAFYRIADLGKRTNDDTAKFTDIALGSKGMLAGWDYSATYTHSESDVKGNVSGYPGALAIAGLRASGVLDPFVGPGQQSAAGVAGLNAVNYKGYWDGGVTKLDTLGLRGSREIAALPAGPLLLGAGVSYNRENFESKPSLFAQGLLSDPVAGTLCDPVNAPDLCDQRFGDASAKPPYSASRNSYGLFGELVIPALKTLELTTSVRYDHYSDFGNATTAKASFRWTPASNVLFRGSIGTGFHAPTVPQVNAARQSYGVTSDKYTCTPDLQTVATSLGAQCQPGNRQYDQVAGGNKDLTPEKSIQGTLGLRIEPSSSVSIGADIWHVGIRDAFGQITEQEVFGNPLAYPKSWSTQKDIGTGVTYLAFLADNQNLGKEYRTGIDFDITGKTRTGLGDLTTNLALTYMIRDVAQLSKGGEYFSAIANNAERGIVTFRWQGKLTTTLKTDNFAHTFALNFKSGYKDQETTVERLDAAGNVVATEDIRLTIKRFATLDWQTQWTPRKDMAFTVGILNVLNTDPPFSLSTGGFNKGQQFGYDDRYYDPRGRTLYANISYKF